MTFYLLYEELLQRKRGIYEHVINLTPRQKLKAFGIDVSIVHNKFENNQKCLSLQLSHPNHIFRFVLYFFKKIVDFTIFFFSILLILVIQTYLTVALFLMFQIQIKENRPLKDLSVPGLKRQGILLQNSTEMLDEAHILKDPSHPGSARISYRPKLEVLQKMLQSKHALQFSAKYDVDRHEDKGGGGEIQVLDGYFAHFVAPENLPPMAKHVQFVLDTSGSMEGKKLQQLKEAMKSILEELRSQDFFSILQFSDDVKEWRASMASASKENVAEAKAHIEALQALGGTNIHEGLRKALSRLQEQQASVKALSAMIIFLTDGHATSGITQKDRILMDIQAANSKLTGSLGGERDGVPIFCLSFGRFADFDLLKVLALQNHGFSRKIYIAADAALQLQGFYQEVSSPLLQNVDFTYQNSEILSNSLTSTNFHTYYQGSEMVVAGRVVTTSTLDHHRDDLIEYQILATQANGQDYLVKGQNQQQAEFYPQTITETVFDVLPRVRQSVNGVNFLERLWAYLTIKDLLERVAKGDLNSCNEFESKIEKRSLPPSSTIDDEDYDEEEGSGGNEYDYVEDILDEVGDDDNIVICDNIEYALYLSLKYEFVTPLTSLVVVGPDDAQQEGDLSEAEGHTRRHTPQIPIHMLSRSNHYLILDLMLLKLLLLSTIAFS